MKLLAIIVLCLVAGCASIKPVPEIEKIKSDLIGQTTGGREKSWLFQTAEQISDLKVLDATEDEVTVSMVLHDSRNPKFFYVEARLTYKQGKLDTVGLLFIKQL